MRSTAIFISEEIVRGSKMHGEMNRILALILILIGSSSRMHARGENNIWTFGKGSGLNFNLGAPVFWENSMFSKEGCAAISDAFGNLIFYTSGNSIQSDS
jgi:hypothetical protein